MGYIFFLAPLILEVACIIHAIKTGRNFLWVVVIFFLPMVGCIAYFAVEIMPDLMRSRASHRFATNVRAAANPYGGLKQAQRAVEMVGSIDAKRALAEQYVARGAYAEAVALYQGMLVGQFHDDPALLQGLARAQFLAGDGAGAQASLDALQKADPGFMTEDARLLYARALELQGKDGEALEEYRKLVRYFAGEEARCRYAMLLKKTGAEDEARSLFAEILKSLDGAPRHYRRAQQEWGDIARAGLK
ncbi:MAG: tetratricopeptide repeat protein [Rhizomicrobium sp.]